MGRWVSCGWKLPLDERDRLLAIFPPAYSRVIADHVTLRNGTNAATPLPPLVAAHVVGLADDGDSLQCLVAEVDGTTDRTDGSTFHITWSLGEGRRAVESNDLLRRGGWQALDEPIPVRLDPSYF